MYNVTLDLYKFEELADEAKDQAIIIVREDYLFQEYDYEHYNSFEEYQESLTDGIVKDVIIVNEYLFFKNGNIANTVLNTISNTYSYFEDQLKFEVKEIK